MNVGFDFDFPRGLKFYALEAFTYDGNYYDPMIADLSTLQLAISDDHGFTVSNMTVTMNDQSGVFRAMQTDIYNRNFIGKDVTLRQVDGTPIRKFFIEKGYPTKGPTGADVFVFVLSDQINELNRDIIEVIDEEYFPASETIKAYGEAIPRVYRNNESSSSRVMIKCWHVNKTHTVTDYLLSSREVNVITRVENENGEDRTGTAFITQEDGLYYIKLQNPVNGECVVANVQPTNIDTPYEVIVDLMGHYFPGFGGATFSDTALENWLEKNDYQQYFAIGEQMTGVELLKMICDSFNLEWYVDANREIYFFWIDPANLTANLTLQEAEIENFNIDNADAELMFNRYIVNFDYDNFNERFVQSHIFNFKKNQELYGIKEKPIDLRFLDSWGDIRITRPMDAWKTVKKRFWESDRPKVVASINVRDDLIIDNYPGQFISFPHQDALGTDERLYSIRSINYDFINDTAFVTLWDYDHLKTLRTADKLLIHSDTNSQSTINLDSAVDGWNYPYLENSAVHSVAQSPAPFGDSSMYFADKYIKWLLASATEKNFDMAAVSNFTCDFWVNFQQLPIGLDDCILAGYNSADAANDYWEIEVNPSDQIKFNYVDGGSLIIGLTSTATIDSEWRHIALIKVGSNIGVYLGGTQILYSNTAISSINADAFIIGKNSTLGNYGFISVDEVHVSHDNFFEAAPVAGLTDVIIPMNTPYNDYSTNMENSNRVLREDYSFKLREDGGYKLRE